MSGGGTHLSIEGRSLGADGIGGDNTHTVLEPGARWANWWIFRDTLRAIEYSAIRANGRDGRDTGMAVETRILWAIRGSLVHTLGAIKGCARWTLRLFIGDTFFTVESGILRAPGWLSVNTIAPVEGHSLRALWRLATRTTMAIIGCAVRAFWRRNVDAVSAVKNSIRSTVWWVGRDTVLPIVDVVLRAAGPVLVYALLSVEDK